MTPACINPLRDPPNADRILVIRLGAMGDVVRTLPAVAELRARYPRAQLAWLVERKAEAAVRGQPGIDEVIVFPREELTASLRARRSLALVREAAAFARELRRRRFDLAVDFHGILKSGVLARLSGARDRVGYAHPFARELASAFANRRARVAPGRVSRFVRNAALVDFLGADGAVARAEAGEGRGFAVDARARDRMREALEKLRAGRGDPSGPRVLIHPGSSAATPHKRYPELAWGAVARELSEAGASCWIAAGGSDEQRLAGRVVAASGGRARLAPKTSSLGDLAALSAACDLLLGSDSGPLHLASLAGTPVVQLLGPTDPVENRPWPGTPYRALRVPVACSPCRRGCAAASCMQVVPVRAVVDAARELLALERSA